MTDNTNANSANVASFGDFELTAEELQPAPAPRIFTPSPQQAEILAWVRKGRGSAFIEAVAGAGKTTTLVEVCKLLRGSVAFAAYNKKIADEIQAKLNRAGVDRRAVRAGTFHSFGFSALRYKLGNDVLVDERKKWEAVAHASAVPVDIEAAVKTLVSLARQAGAGFLFPIEGEDAFSHWMHIVEHHDLTSRLSNPDGAGVVKALIGFAQSALADGNEIAARDRIVDYDDMIYLPLLWNLRMWQNDWVLVDEAQDTNPARRALARRMLKPGGRAVFVGDPAQAIYGFTGADADAIAQIKRDFNCASLPLTVTYRCPKSVVAMAQQWVSHIQAADSAPNGITRSVNAETFATVEVPTLQAHDAILCRNTRPLVALAFSLIRRGIACHVEGRDIGAGLLNLLGRWKVTSINGLRKNLEAYREREMARAMAKGNEYGAEAINDRVETLFILMEGCDTVECVRSKVSRLFADTPEGRPAPTLTLSTIHKAKGREWDRVYLLGFNHYCPSPYARQDWQQEQERNLMYVAVTRAKHELVITPPLGE